MEWISGLEHDETLNQINKNFKGVAKIRISKDSTQFELYVMPVTEAADVTKERKFNRLTNLFFYFSDCI